MDSVRIYEVTMRDGLQNEPDCLSTDGKLAMVGLLLEAGHRDIEITSFVKPSWIPQLADGDQLARALHPAPEGVRYWCLVPNRRGLERAIDAGVQNIATFMSASETHNRKNLNRTQLESLSILEDVIGIAKDEGLGVRSYLSTVFGCPYEGEIPAEKSLDLAKRLLDMGADELALGDTTGMGNPIQVQECIGLMEREGVPLDRLALHMHDTRGTALANCLAGYQAGIRCFDASTAGLGGCPYAPGAAGNAATEDLVQMFNAMGCNTGISLGKTAEAGIELGRLLGRELPGRYHRYHKGSRARDRRTA
jgi:hydroxymethylglutaryl-CoA lyase